MEYLNETNPGTPHDCKCYVQDLMGENANEFRARTLNSHIKIAKRTQESVRTPPRQQVADAAAHRPCQQPGEPVPVRPTLAPIGNRRPHAHHFPDAEKPQHMSRWKAWRK